MKIAAVKKFTQVLVAMAVAAVMAALLCAPKALGTTIGEFSIEQIYVNVPELDVFVQATDAQGQPISPDLVRAAGVELYLGDEKIPTGNIGMANEPICYVLAVDNSVDETTLKEYRIALRRLISAKGAKDQIMLYTLAGDAACVLPATIDTRAAVNAVNALESQEENEPNLVQAATIIYNDINENYQSIAPRKVIFALAEAGNTATSTALLGAVAKDAASRLSMPLDIFVTVDDDNPLAELGKALGGDMIGLFAYYIASPLNLLVVFFPVRALPWFVLLLTLLKTGLAGTAFAAWARCAAWMVFIFMMSAMPGDVSGEQSGFVTEMIEKALTFVFGAQTAGGIPVDALEMVVRKCAHMGEYAVLFWLWAHALSVSGAKHPARTALIVCAAYAASDEFHQCFSNGRGPSPVDVMIDIVGAAIALLLRAAALHIRERGEERKP